MSNCENCTKRKWLEFIMQDCFKEDDDLALIGVGTLRNAARSTIWQISSYYGYNRYGVPGNTSRIFQLFVASLVRRLTWHAGIENADLVRHIVGPQLPLLVACCFLLAIKSSKARSGITHKSIYNYFHSMGVHEYTISRIRDMEREIFEKIGYQLPMYSSVDIAEMLAAELAVPAPTLKLACALVEVSEARQHFIENTMRSIAMAVIDERHIPPTTPDYHLLIETILMSPNITTSTLGPQRSSALRTICPAHFHQSNAQTLLHPVTVENSALEMVDEYNIYLGHTVQLDDARIKTLHLSASCVVAAVQCDLGLSEAMRVAERLENLISVPKAYIRTLSNVVLAGTAEQPPNYFANYSQDSAYEISSSSN